MAAKKAGYEAITLPEKLNIRNINNIRDIIFKNISDGNSCLFEIPDDAEADLSFIQLMTSALVYSDSAKTDIKISKPASGSVLDVLKRSGFVGSLSERDREFWFQSEEIA